MTTTTEIGNAFRDAVCALLRTQHQDAAVEQRLGGTKVDILFSKYVFGRREVYAAECKAYSKPLTKTYIATEIYPLYEPLLRIGDIQRLLIVSRHPIGADAAAYLNSWPNVSHQTLEELAESLVGLRPYIDKLAHLKPTDDTDYVDARLEGVHGPALDYVDAWVRSDEGRGLAILGGYGQGKTSFARRLAAHYASRHLADPMERMPLLLRLGEVVHETQLEGLFGKEFTARNPCPGYQFSTLLHLNSSGRLVIILDGFDEMKHAMTASDFQSNFREFNRLLEGSAKVILLGRPNALPSDERDLVFRGKVQVGGQLVSSGTYAAWSERKVAFFETDEARKLLASSLGALQRRHAESRTYVYADDFVQRRVAEVFELVPSDLLRRPVHVQLIAEVAANPTFDLRGFNEYRLYDHFIRTMVERDTVQKHARKAISLDARLTFQRELAWWAWRRPGVTQGCFFRHEVPQALLQPLPAGNTVDEEGKRNEYIVSTLTEEKESGVLFFAHRSFQEFLVAERLRLVPPAPAAHAEISNLITSDVVSFLRQAPDMAFAIDWYESLRVSNGPINTAVYLQFLALVPELIEHVRAVVASSQAREIDLWTVMILYLAWDGSAIGAFDDIEHERFMLQIVTAGRTPSAAAAALALLTAIDKRKGTMPIQLAAAVMERPLRFGRSEKGSLALTMPHEDYDFSAAWLESLAKEVPAKGATTSVKVKGELTRLGKLCSTELATYIDDDWLFSSLDEEKPFAGDVTKVLALMDARVRDTHRDWLLGRGESLSVVKVDQRTKRALRYS